MAFSLRPITGYSNSDHGCAFSMSVIQVKLFTQRVYVHGNLRGTADQTKIYIAN